MLYKLINIMPYVLLGVSIFILMFSFWQKNNNFFDIRNIIKEHNKIIKNKSITFHVVPILMSIGITILKPINKEIIENINVVMAIFLSMFFAMMSIISSFNKSKTKEYLKLKNETFNELLFEAIIGVNILIIGFVVLFMNIYTLCFFIKLVSLILYWLIFVQLLGIFVLLKRIKILHDEN